MSKTVKEMIMREYADRLDGTSDAMLISIRGVSAIETTRVRNVLRKKDIRVAVIRNALARRNFAGTGLEALVPLLKGPSALAFGGQSVVEVAREIVKLVEQFPGIELKGAVLDGTLFQGKKGVEELSKFPTKDEAIGRIVTLIVSPARKLMAQVKGPGANIAGIVKAIEEKLEKGETIAKVG
jgi:large subunit ribosomal protein L10